MVTNRNSIIYGIKWRHVKVHSQGTPNKEEEMKLLFEVPQEVKGKTNFAWQSVLGNFVAVAGVSGKEVIIYTRQGKLVTTISLPGLCTSLDWDKEGEHLAIAQDFSGVLFLWNSNNQEVSKLQTGLKEGLSLTLWAKHSSLLAVGTIKGNLILYNQRTRRKVPILGKHNKRITSGAWSDQNVLALTGEDRKVTFSDQDGNSIGQREIKFEVHSLKFSPDGAMLSAIGDVKILYFFELSESVIPLELIFEPHYGDITSHAWYNNEQVILGFSKGFMIIVSRKRDEMGRELFQSRNHKGQLNDIDIAPSAPLLATASNHQIKLHEFQDLQGMYGMVEIEDLKGNLHKLQWTDDSQLLSVSLKNGGLMTFLVQLPQLGDQYDTTVAYLTSLTQVKILHIGSEEPSNSITCPIEPTVIAVGSSHLAVAMNNRVWYTELTGNGAFNEKAYVGTVNSVKLNQKFAAVLTNGTIELHLIKSSFQWFGGEEQQSQKMQTKKFPDEGMIDTITCFDLTSNFLIYGTENGTIAHFGLDDWQLLNEFKHVLGITHLYPDATGTKLVIIDDKCDAFLFNSVNDTLIALPDVSPSVVNIVWESFVADKYIFVASDKEYLTTFVYYRDTIEGPLCVSAGTTELQYGYKPLHLYQGELSCVTLTGKLDTVRLQSHFYSDTQDIIDSEIKMSFDKSLKLKKFKEAWSFASALDRVDCWQELASAALYHFDIETAILASQQIRDVSFVYSLKEILSIEDRNLVAGYIFMYKGDHSRAQELFLESSEPTAALDMQCDLLHWDQALDLATTLDPSRIPLLSRQYAQQLESIGDYAGALVNYEKGITNDPEAINHDDLCVAGMARAALHTGDMRRGLKLAQVSSDKQLKKECAMILDNLKLFSEAGSLFEQAEYLEEAATSFIKIKNWDKVGQLLSKLPHAAKLHAQYAKAAESDGQYQAAAIAYERAMNYQNAARVYLDYLKLPDEAVRVVNESQSVEAARLVAKFFQKINDYASALRFLVLSKCNDEAFHMAESHNKMDEYAEVIGDNGATEDYLKIAFYYEKSDSHFKTGVFYLKGKEYSKAMNHFLSCSTSLFPDGEHIEMAIEVVGKAKQESLTAQLYSYLMGELDGEPKEARFLFSMYMSLSQYCEAAQTAILIAREDQNAGNYRSARDMLYQMYNDLLEHNIKIPTEMKQSLMILHSYLLVKLQVKLGSHDKAARLLVRVASNISKFPSHIVPILTSTVIECQRSGLKDSAFTYAAMLMRPEYRPNIDARWKKKLESIVRKPERSEVEDSTAPCPFCSFMLPQMRLDCPQCKNNLPYCIITGRHMVADDWSECPSCHFPALYSEFKKLLESENSCPLCSAEVSFDKIQLISDIQAKLKNYC